MLLNVHCFLFNSVDLLAGSTTEFQFNYQEKDGDGLGQPWLETHSANEVDDQ